MQFQVPQFIDVEDKIIGPLTIKQFLYLLGGVGLAYMSYRFIPYLGVLIGFGFLGLGGALAFYKFNNKPFVYLIESSFNYVKSNRLYIWKRTERGETELDLSNFKPTKHAAANIPVAATTQSKLNDLTWSIDMQQKEIETQKVHGDPTL